MAAPLIEFQNVTLLRNERLALDSVTLAIDVGEHVAILGPNGSGKSSLIKAITRECYPRFDPDGRSWVRILGRDVWNVFSLRALLGIVTNDLMQACQRDITAHEAILSGFFSSIGLHHDPPVTAAMRKRVDEVLELLEIVHLAERPVDEMSSGEARRVLIGRALAHDPKALLLDEPTNSLDVRATHELREVIRKLASSGISIIMVTHHLPDIIPEIGRVVLLNQGRIHYDGSKECALTTGRLSELFGMTLALERRDGYYNVW